MKSNELQEEIPTFNNQPLLLSHEKKRILDYLQNKPDGYYSVEELEKLLERKKRESPREREKDVLPLIKTKGRIFLLGKILSEDLEAGSKLKYAIEIDPKNPADSIKILKIQNSNVVRKSKYKDKMSKNSNTVLDQVEKKSRYEFELLSKLNRTVGDLIIVADKTKGQEKNIDTMMLMNYEQGKLLNADEIMNVTWNDKKEIVKNILLELNAIHKLGIYHGDISSNNIIIGADFKAKIIDFGSASEYGFNKKALQESAGMIAYSAPERGETKTIETGTTTVGYATEKTDVYALGLCLAEFLGFAEFKSMHGGAGVWVWQPQPDNEPEKSAYYLCQLMTNSNPLARPSLEIVIKKWDVISNPTTKQILEGPRDLKSTMILGDILHQLNQISKLKLSDPHKKNLKDFIDDINDFANNKKDVINHDVALASVVEKLAIFFTSQSNKYKNTLSAKLFSKTPIEILNENTKDHYLTRGIGSILKNLKNESVYLKEIGVDLSKNKLIDSLDKLNTSTQSWENRKNIP